MTAAIGSMLAACKYAFLFVAYLRLNVDVPKRDLMYHVSPLHMLDSAVLFLVVAVSGKLMGPGWAVLTAFWLLDMSPCTLGSAAEGCLLVPAVLALPDFFGGAVLHDLQAAIRVIPVCTKLCRIEKQGSC